MASKTVASFMTKDVVTLLEEDNLEHIAEGLERYRFHHIPVVDGRRVVGMVSSRDMLRATVSTADGSATARSREARYLENTFVRDVMASPIVTVAPTATLAEAASMMLSARVGALPVVDGEANMVGIVTAHDLMRSIAEDG